MAHPAHQVLRGIVLTRCDVGADIADADIEDGGGDKVLYFERDGSEETFVDVGRRPAGTLEPAAHMAGYRSPVMSRHHCKIILRANGASAVDATSHHGTHLQRAGAEFPEQLARNTPYPLSSGDVLTFGKTLGKDDQFFAPIAVRIQCTFGPDERALALPALSALLSRVSPAPAPTRSWGRFGADGEAASSRASSSSGDSDIKEIPCPGAGAQSRSSSSSASTSSSPGLALVPLDDDAAGPSAGPRPVACARLPSIDGLLRHISWPALLPPLRHSAAHARSTAAGLLFFPRALSPALALEPPVGPDAVQAQSADMDVDMDISEDMGVDADAPREVGLSRIDAILNTIEAEMAASAPSSAYMDAVRPGSPRPLPSFECGTCLQREAVVVENSPPHFAEEQQDEVVPAEDAVEGSVAVPKPDAESPIEALSVRLSKLESSLEVILSPQAAQQDEAALEAGPSVRPQALVDAVAALQQDVREMSSAANTVNERATSADTRAAQLERRIDTVEERMRDLVCADTLMEHGEVKPAVEALRALVAEMSAMRDKLQADCVRKLEDMQPAAVPFVAESQQRTELISHKRKRSDSDLGEELEERAASGDVVPQPKRARRAGLARALAQNLLVATAGGVVTWTVLAFT